MAHLRNFAISICFVLLTLGGSAFGSCSAPQNAIEAENCLPGTTGWEVGNGGDATIQGFTTDISVNAGQTVNFKISTTATSYHIDIYRMGYYGGTGGRYITTIQPSAQLPQAQPACLTDTVTRLYDCGNWGVSASWTIPANAVSGVYIAAPVRGDTGGANQIFFIVRNDASHADVLFQTSDETWQAYNPYGGHSFYGDSGFDLTNRAYKVSYNRPFNTDLFSPASWWFSAEYPMMRWLEANGYDVSYFTSVDAARNGNLITNHKLYLSLGHDEYWSGPKRTNVEAARAAGVNLAFFSGNEGFWKTRWEKSIDGSNTQYRTLVCYKETLGPNSTPTATTAVDPLDPPTWTGTWRDPSKSPPADGGRPENSLNGTLFRVNGPGPDNTNLSIKVPAADGKLRFWRNTAIASQAPGQTWTLPAGTLGYEWDVEEDNGFRPAGLFDLSTSTYSLTNDYLLDYGGLYGAGTATHHLTMYRFRSGALVFGAGTIQWSWGLDGTAADANMQQATVNLFADMGVQPVTLQGGLIPASKSADVQPPASTITSPTSGSTVQFGVPVTITGTAVDFGGGAVAAVEVSTDGGQTWHPASGRESWSYTWMPSISGDINVLSRAVDDSANLETPSSNVVVTVPSLPLSIDAQVSTDGFSASTTIQSPSFSTSAGNELLLAFVATDYTSGANTTVTGVTGGGLTWALAVRANAQSGTSEIWRALATSTLSGTTVIATMSQNVVASITVMSFAGVNTSGTNGSGAIGATASKSASTGAPSATVVTTQNDSWVLGVGNDYDNPTPRSAGSGQSLVHQFLTSSGDTYWVQKQNSPTSATGTGITINDTAPTGDRWNLAVAEVIPGSPGTLSISGTVTPSAVGNGTTITLSGTVSAATVGNSSGNYSFSGLINGSYTLTPRKTGVVFSPVSQTVTLNGTSIGGVNFNSVTLSSIALTPANVTIQSSSTQQFTATGTYSDGSTQNISTQVTWSSSNTGVATINTSGLASAVAGGISTITATQGAVSGNSTLNVQGPQLAIATTSLPGGIQNQSYSATLTASGGTAPYTWSLATGSVLPAGLTLSSAGQITGAPAVTGSSTFTVRAADSGSPQQAATKQLSIVVSSVPVIYTIWSSTAAPTTADAGADSPLELGVKFRADVNGTITGIRFYKSNNNTGTHIGNLWSSTGALLESATFTSEAASGWQQANFSTPVAITAGTVYTASYHMTVGHYSADKNYFASGGVDTPPLHALQDGVNGANGVFAYGNSSVFPNSGFASSNYWVDVVFLPSATLTSIAVTPVNSTIQVGSIRQFTATGTYSDGTTQDISTQVNWLSSNTNVVTINSSGVVSSISAGTSTISAGIGSLSNSTNVNVQVSSTVSHTIWNPAIVPTLVDAGADSPVELGVAFKVDVSGTITGIRFYKSASNTGAHVANLWSSSGTLLATANFTSETASGWQQVVFSTPIGVTAGAVYVASYHTTTGHYSDDQNYFLNAGVDAPPLHALQDGTNGSDGVFAYGSKSLFPTNGYHSSNFWVDVVFTTSQ
jgi:hypothetical protein